MSVARWAMLEVLELSIYVAVLGSAFMNATWNSMIRGDRDRDAMMMVMMLVEGALALCALPFIAVPGPGVWPWLLAGTALRVTYSILLIRAYAQTELSRIYPIARGAAPAMLAAFGLVSFSERLSAGGVLAVIAISAGVLLIARIDQRPRPDTRALRFGLLLSAFIAAYSLVDARGVRASGDPFAYAAFAFLGEVIGFMSYWLIVHGSAALVRVGPVARSGIAAGILGTLSYLIALWAFSRAPAALVAALRETSVLFAVALARVTLRERVVLRDWVGALLIFAGAASLRI